MQNLYLEQEPLSKLMRKFAVPCVISLLVGALYNIVDQIFIANASYLGSYGNAANTVVFPLTVIALAIAVMIGDGCSTFIAMALGAKDSDNAGKAVGSGILVTVLSGLFLMVVYYRFSERILIFFGGMVNEETFLYAKEYFFWITAGIPFYMFGQGLNPIIRADGSPKYAMAATLAGALTNIVLDPILIFLVRWGMTGAAIATVAGQIVTVIMTVCYLTHMNAVHFNLQDIQLHASLLKKYLPLGFTSFFSQISLVAAMASVNSMVQKYSLLDPVFSNPAYTQIPMAVIGIVMKFFQIVISIVVGTAAGCAPVAAYNTGAGRKDRVWELFKLLMMTETITGFIALIVAECLPKQLISVFGSANESVYYTAFAVKTFRIYLSMIVPACINKAVFIYLQALGKTLSSTVLSMMREIIFGVFLPILLPLRYGLSGILYSMPIADVLIFIMTVFVLAVLFQAWPVKEKHLQKSLVS